MVAHPSVKEFLLSNNLNGKMTSWITRVMEYDVDIQVTKLYRGKGLCEQLPNGRIQTTDDMVEIILAN